jgi:hypothetical protein
MPGVDACPIPAEVVEYQRFASRRVVRDLAAQNFPGDPVCSLAGATEAEFAVPILVEAVSPDPAGHAVQAGAGHLRPEPLLVVALDLLLH